MLKMAICLCILHDHTTHIKANSHMVDSFVCRRSSDVDVFSLDPHSEGQTCSESGDSFLFWLLFLYMDFVQIV